MSIITVSGLQKRYLAKQKESGLFASVKSLFKSTYREVDAVNDISFAVDEGEVVAFIGPNGAGKSTTIKILTGILYPTAGQARVLGLVPWQERRELAHLIGTVFGQKSQLWYHLPPQDSFQLLGSIYELDRDEATSRIQYLCELFEIEDLVRTPVRKLSLGQRMRCEIAASVLHRPRVLFLDEPTIGLDVVARLQIRDFIRRLNREEGVTIFLTSHDAGDIEQICKRVVIINHGKLILDVPTSTLKHNYLNSKIVGIKLAEPLDQLELPEAEVLKHTAKGIKLKLDTGKFSVDGVLSKLLDQARIEDISITDPSMEQIIEGIYRNPPRKDETYEAS